MTNTPPIPPSRDRDDQGHLDASLVALAAELDRLGLAKGASAPKGLEARVVQASLAHFSGVVGVSAQASELGAMDRAAAPPALEARVHEASRGLLASPALRLAGTPAQLPPQRSRWFAAPMRIAAMLTLAGGAGLLAWIGTRPAAPSTEELSLQIKGDMEILFAAMEDRVPSTADTTGDSSDIDTQSLSEWLFEASS